MKSPPAICAPRSWRRCCATLAKRLPSEAQLEGWEERLTKLDRVRELVDQTIPPPSLMEVLEEGQRRLESQSTED